MKSVIWLFSTGTLSRGTASMGKSEDPTLMKPILLRAEFCGLDASEIRISASRRVDNMAIEWNSNASSCLQVLKLENKDSDGGTGARYALGLRDAVERVYPPGSMAN